MNKRSEYWPIRLQLLSLLSNVSERLWLAGFYYVLIIADFPECSLHLFDDSDFQMESSARFPKIDATDLLEIRASNQSKNNQRSRKTWIKVLDLWRAERSKERKLEEIPEHELHDLLGRFYAEIRKQNGCSIINR